MSAHEPNEQAIAEALRASELRYRRLFESAKDGILILDAVSGLVVEVNPFLVELLGLSHEALLGKKIWELGFFKNIADNEVKFAELQAQDYVRYEDLPLNTSDGRAIWVEFVSNVYLVNQQRVLQCNFRDITPHKRMEAALRQEQILMLTLMDNVPDHIYFKDTASRFIRINPGLAKVFGLSSPAQAVGKTDADFFSEEHALAALADEQAILRTGQPLQDVEEKETWPDGSESWVLTSKVPLRDGAGRMIGTCGISCDITARKRAEVALRQEQILMLTLMNNVPDHIYFKDTASRFLRINPGLAKRFGLDSPEQAVGKSDADFFSAEHALKALADEQAILRTGQPLLDIEEKETWPDGSEGWVVTSKVPLWDDAGRITGTCGISNDITARKRAEAAQREHEERLQFALDVIDTGEWDLDLVNHSAHRSLKHDQIFGYEAPVPHWTYELFLEHVVPEDRAAVDHAFRQAMEAKGDWQFECRIRRRDGEQRWILGSGRHYFDPSGQPRRMVGIVQDITPRKRAAESQARLATAVEQAAESIVITDTDGTIRYANPACLTITGYTRRETYGQNPRILKSGKHDAAFYRDMWATLTAGNVWSGHLINKRKDGTLYEEDATISPVLDAEGKIINYVAVKRDVTREVALEAQTRQATKMEAVGQLAGGVAHDFNNQLQIILGCAELILGHLPPDHPIQTDLLEIQKAARHSADLTRQLLAFSRKQMIAPVVLDLNAAISGSLKMLRRLIGENIRLLFVQQPDPGCVFMDPGQLDQVLANLAVNARDAMRGTGEIALATTRRVLQEADCLDKPDFVPPGDYVELTFHDDGAGMTPEIQAHLFEPFFTTKGVGKGTGLGLATVYGIIKQNHGAITVHSAPGAGTTFTIYLPRSGATARAAAGAATERMPTGTETVLLAEDDENVLNLVQRTLTQQGYRILKASSPQQALQVCAQHPEPIHLLLTDVIMPDMSGKALAERIQQLRPGIRVLYMSGYPADIMEQHGHLPENLHVLQKPFAAAALAQQLRAALDAPPTPPPVA